MLNGNLATSKKITVSSKFSVGKDFLILLMSTLHALSQLTFETYHLFNYLFLTRMYV